MDQNSRFQSDQLISIPLYSEILINESLEKLIRCLTVSYVWEPKPSICFLTNVVT